MPRTVRDVQLFMVMGSAVLMAGAFLMCLFEDTKEHAMVLGTMLSLLAGYSVAVACYSRVMQTVCGNVIFLMAGLCMRDMSAEYYSIPASMSLILVVLSGFLDHELPVPYVEHEEEGEAGVP